MKKQRILIVDDTPSNIKVLNNLLQYQYQISAVTNGPDALELAKSANRPDLVLLDIMMPEMNGFEVAKILKKNKKTLGIPIIFITANTETQSIIHGFAIGGNDYITKPIQPEELLARVQTHLEIGRAHV